MIGLVVGAVSGRSRTTFSDSLNLNDILVWTDTIGRIFLRLVFMVVLPLVISALRAGRTRIG